MIEIIHYRDPDRTCDLVVFVDGKEVAWTDAKIETIDPGAGWEGLKGEWDRRTRDLTGSPAFVATARKLRDAVAADSPYVTDTIR